MCAARSGSSLVYANVVGDQLHRKRLAQHPCRIFAATVHSEAAAATHGAGGRGAGDATTALRPHQRSHSADAEKHTKCMGTHDLVLMVQRRLLSASQDHETGIAEQNTGAAEGASAVVPHRKPLLFDRHVQCFHHRMPISHGALAGVQSGGQLLYRRTTHVGRKYTAAAPKAQSRDNAGNTGAEAREKSSLDGELAE
ncbi:hypothetical protein ABL78_8307 [Leptomonas seymouri]|uniref:Uncharacterized protein n=1 Tax=Leptomonas seymouri TaxID=5684 RepID=A0A0N1P913_LEPSE|nr:hypothetical protein ABL78_8307 [Leptomonas seymouri]|eukprot:KPI82680.1 hypothetical protein ABL78_8307 [Leptomonas seymouri]